MLRESDDDSHRALAAQVIAYAADKRAVVDDLAAAMRDPASEVRNNAMRALALFAQYAREHPESNLSVPSTPFVDLLNSIDWSDRNKSAAALLALTEGRDAALLNDLRDPGARVTDRDGPLEEPGPRLHAVLHPRTRGWNVRGCDQGGVGAQGSGDGCQGGKAEPARCRSAGVQRC